MQKGYNFIDHFLIKLYERHHPLNLTNSPNISPPEDITFMAQI